MTWFQTTPEGVYAYNYGADEDMTFEMYHSIAGKNPRVGDDLVIDCINVRLTYRVRGIQERWNLADLEFRVAEPKLEVA